MSKSLSNIIFIYFTLSSGVNANIVNNLHYKNANYNYYMIVNQYLDEEMIRQKISNFQLKSNNLILAKIIFNPKISEKNSQAAFLKLKTLLEEFTKLALIKDKNLKTPISLEVKTLGAIDNKEKNYSIIIYSH
ncbi:hypothetical protein ABSA28_00096 [Candidatus Hepatincolaceae symbiont of Richtersius coronifer]